jgi:hypothetical protein
MDKWLKKYSAIVFCLFVAVLNQINDLMKFDWFCYQYLFAWKELLKLKWYIDLVQCENELELLDTFFIHSILFQSIEQKGYHILSHFSTQLDSSFWVHSKKKYVSRIGKKTFSLRSTNIYTRKSHIKFDFHVGSARTSNSY